MSNDSSKRFRILSLDGGGSWALADLYPNISDRSLLAKFVHNQPIRANRSNLSPEIGVWTFGEAKNAWRVIAGPP